MPLEQEIPTLLIIGFSIVMSVSLVTIVILWMKNKNLRTPYGWTILHLLLCSLAIFMFIETLDSDYNHPMASEENSLRLGISAIVWTCSIFSLVMGVLQFTKINKGRKTFNDEY